LSVRFYYGPGSPYAWRVWLALEHKGIPYHRKTLSFDPGDLKTAEFGALNPRRRVPVLVDDDFALAESAAIVEYIEERWASGPALFAGDPRQRAIQRRLVREADDYLVDLGQRRAKARRALNDLRRELALWEDAALSGPACLAGNERLDSARLSAVARSRAAGGSSSSAVTASRNRQRETSP
jgi:glutathione S-transferase